MDIEKLKEKIVTEVQNSFEKELDFIDILITDDERYKKLRSKILRLGNNCIRNLIQYIDENTK